MLWAEPGFRAEGSGLAAEAMVGGRWLVAVPGGCSALQWLPLAAGGFAVCVRRPVSAAAAAAAAPAAPASGGRTRSGGGRTARHRNGGEQLDRVGVPVRADGGVVGLGHGAAELEGSPAGAAAEVVTWHTPQRTEPAVRSAVGFAASARFAGGRPVQRMRTGLAAGPAGTDRDRPGPAELVWRQPRSDQGAWRRSGRPEPLNTERLSPGEGGRPVSGCPGSSPPPGPRSPAPPPAR